ncbi:hypothetical protein ABZ299_19275 [Streptomyces sp. NPDC006184]|uniref:hypothetical protein n=1 Tax=Streptomyces sp. NPDC006184 TaxID=3155455 RepID=UPI0033A29502
MDIVFDSGARRSFDLVIGTDGLHSSTRRLAFGPEEKPFFDVVSQIHLPTGSSGRVALAGDAAHATSFLSGQGSSVSLVGAYVLAGEPAARADHTEAFAA